MVQKESNQHRLVSSLPTSQHRSKLLAFSAVVRFVRHQRPATVVVMVRRNDTASSTVGAPLSWEQARPYFNYVRDHGIQQFVSQYRSHEGVDNDELKWGDEVEYAILKMDHENKRVKISTRASDVLKELQMSPDKEDEQSHGCTWMPEYGSWMVEGTPKVPYGGLASHLAHVEGNMRLRRKRLNAALAEDEIAPTMTNFPLFGVGWFTSPPVEPAGPKLQSEYVPDSVIHPHPRFEAATDYIRERRGRKIDVQIPLYEDYCTPEFQSKPDGTEAPAHRSIHMDATAFGSGCCCLQVTCQARNVDESRYLFDQLAVFSPIMLALSAATPIHRGRLADTDVRWDTISLCADDRTLEEMRPSTYEPIAGKLRGRRASSGDNRRRNFGARRQPKSRYGSVSTYIYNCCGSDSCTVMGNYNDIDCPVDEPSHWALLEQGIDPVLSKHVSHLFTRDPLVVLEGRIEEVDDNMELDHFESIQSTNWQTVRWKPPPQRVNASDPHIGWRTEFRTLEIQLTDFENAAYAVFVSLVTRAILAFGLNFYIPISKVDDNMKRAHNRDAATKGEFFFRSNIGFARPPPSSEGCVPGSTYRPCADEPQNGFEEMAVLEILEGKGDFMGLIPVVQAYLEYIDADRSTMDHVDRYLEHLRKRAAGEVMTTAAWLRHFVRSHPGYRMDSVVTDEIAYDLVATCQDIGLGKRACPELLGDRTIEEISRGKAWDVEVACPAIEA